MEKRHLRTVVQRLLDHETVRGPDGLLEYPNSLHSVRRQTPSGGRSKSRSVRGLRTGSVLAEYFVTSVPRPSSYTFLNGSEFTLGKPSAQPEKGNVKRRNMLRSRP